MIETPTVFVDLLTGLEPSMGMMAAGRLGGVFDALTNDSQSIDESVGEVSVGSGALGAWLQSLSGIDLANVMMRVETGGVAYLPATLRAVLIGRVI